MTSRRGFTLIELLVIISIIGVLVGLLLPAVQAAREASRRAQCANNFRQVGLALANYHATFDRLPIGRTGLYYTYRSKNPSRRTWALSVLPYMEQQATANGFNFDLSFYDRQNATAVQTQIGAYLCPSDRPGLQEPDGPVPRIKASVAANWGNTHYFQDEPNRGAAGPNPFLGPNGTVTFTGAPFLANACLNFSAFGDGTSQTILVGETVIAANRAANGNMIGAYDHRGDIYNDDRNCTMFMTYTSPNSKIPDQMYATQYCGQGLDNNPPCNAASPAFNAARSRHPGGVHVLFADGSVRFTRDGTNINVWRALGSPSAGDVVSADSY